MYPSEGAPGDREAGLLKDAGKRLPLTDEIVFTIVREGITGWNLFLQGYQDAWGVTQTNYQQVMTPAGDALAGDGAEGRQTVPELQPGHLLLRVQYARPCYRRLYARKKRKLRQAISTAFDAQAFIDLQSQGNGSPAQFLIPPGISG